MYVTVEYYKDTYKGNLDEADAEKALKQASRHIDTLTYNRIVDKGFETKKRNKALHIIISRRNKCVNQ